MIRDIFSKANIAVENNKIIISYIGNGWKTESWDDIESLNFLNMIFSSDEISAHIEPGIFYITINNAEILKKSKSDLLESVLYKAKEIEISVEDIQSINNLSDDNAKEFCDFFEDVDLSDDSAVLQRLSEWMDKKNEGIPHIINMEHIRKFQEMQGIIKSIQSKSFFDSRIIKPDYLYAGSVSIDLDSEIRSDYELGGFKDEFNRLFSLSVAVALEVNTDDGFAALTFYI